MISAFADRVEPPLLSWPDASHRVMVAPRLREGAYDGVRFGVGEGVRFGVDST
jgi:hypothetical protein